jgi:uncharacterized protein (DUF2252 family)
METITERLLTYNQNRLPDVVKLKYEAMTESLFRFYRGTNHIFYEDLAARPSIPGSPVSWICGDLHIENFGSFKSDNRQVYFDLNDFDEGMLAPVIWESYRMVTSIFIAFESLGIESKRASHMAELFLKIYTESLVNGKADYIEPNTAKGIVKDFLSVVSKRKQKDILAKRCIEHKNKLEILLADPRHLELNKDEKNDINIQVTEWLKNDGNSPYNYKVVDSVFRLAGTGSLGVRRYAILLKSLNENGEKYLLLDMKQAITSSLKPYVKIKQPDWENEATRIVTIQSIMQNRSPALLSTIIYKGFPYMVEEIQPTSDKINFKLVKKDYRAMCRVVSDMAILAASSQIRSSGRTGSAITDEFIAFGRRKDWQPDVLEYSRKYSYTIKEYYAAYLRDYKKGLTKPIKTQAA